MNNSIFLSVFQSLDFLTQLTQVNYKKIDKNALYNAEQLCYSYNMANDRVINFEFELIVHSEVSMNIYSNKIFVKNVNPTGTPVLMNTMNFIYNEMPFIDYEIKIENNYLNLYVKNNDLENHPESIVYFGIIKYYS